MTGDPQQDQTTVQMPFTVFEKAEQYKNAVVERLKRATQALEIAGVSYAVIGGNAVASWVSTIDDSAARGTQDVDLLLARSDLERAKHALATAGFVYRHAASIDMFLDGPHGKPRQAVHVIFAGEKVRPEYVDPAPVLSDSARSPSNYTVLSLAALVRMKLTSYRLKDRVHLQDLRDVGLIDESWIEKVPGALRERMREIIELPSDELA
jgi:hypothetical protein